jgi:hypothetical protein
MLLEPGDFNAFRSIDNSFKPRRRVAVDALPTVAVRVVLSELAMAKGKNLLGPPWLICISSIVTHLQMVDVEVIPRASLLVEV